MEMLRQRKFSKFCDIIFIKYDFKLKNETVIVAIHIRYSFTITIDIN